VLGGFGAGLYMRFPRSTHPHVGLILVVLFLLNKGIKILVYAEIR